MLGKLLAPALGLWLSTAAWGELSIRQLSLGQTETDVNVRVILANPGVQLQSGPLKVTLFVRPNARAKWRVAKVWSDVQALQPSAFVVKEAFSSSNDVLRRMAREVNWEAHVVVQTRSDQLLAERYEGFYDSAEH